jgi:large subunit ribosomal protein L9
MKVILSKDVSGLGRKGQIKEVSDGYARNFLVARHLALPATASALAQIQKEEGEREDRVKKQEALSHELKKKIDGKSITVSGRAEGNRLFAAIHEDKIAQAINEKFHLAILPKQVIIKQAIKTLGQSQAEIKLTDSLHATVKIEVGKTD